MAEQHVATRRIYQGQILAQRPKSSNHFHMSPALGISGVSLVHIDSDLFVLYLFPSEVYTKYFCYVPELVTVPIFDKYFSSDIMAPFVADYNDVLI